MFESGVDIQEKPGRWQYIGSVKGSHGRSVWQKQQMCLITVVGVALCPAGPSMEFQRRCWLSTLQVASDTSDNHNPA